MQPDYYFKVLNKIGSDSIDHIGNEIQIEKAIALNGLRTVSVKQNQTDEGQTSRFGEMWSEYEKTQYAKADEKIRRHPYPDDYYKCVDWFGVGYLLSDFSDRRKK